MEGELDHLQGGSELERLQAVAEETRKWEAREARLIRRLDELERTESELVKQRGGVKNTTAAATTEESAEVLKSNGTTSTPANADKISGSPGKSDLSPTPVPPTPTVATGDHLSMALLAQQLPPLPKSNRK